MQRQGFIQPFIKKGHRKRRSRACASMPRPKRLRWPYFVSYKKSNLNDFQQLNFESQILAG